VAGPDAPPPAPSMQAILDEDLLGDQGVLCVQSTLYTAQDAFNQFVRNDRRVEQV
jgi:hypothetical protein